MNNCHPEQANLFLDERVEGCTNHFKNGGHCEGATRPKQSFQLKNKNKIASPKNGSQ
jgi:hypothetical protein